MVLFAIGPVLSFVLFIGLISAVYLSMKCNCRPKLMMLVGIGLLLCMLFAGSDPMHALQESTTDTQSAVAAEPVQETTEQLWNRLSPYRINLDDEQPSSADSEKVAKQDSEETPQEKERPNWVDHPPKRVGNVYRQVASAGPYSQAEECHDALDQQMSEVVRQRLEQLVSSDLIPPLESLGLNLDFVLSEICEDEYIETVEASFGEMKHVHVLMRFDPSVDKQLRTAYHEYQHQLRIKKVGGVAGLGLGSLALLLGLLKVDTWTRGYYTKRLFFGVPAVIIAIVVFMT